MACRLLEDIEPVEIEYEKGKVTKSFLRKVLELVDKYETKEEYILSIAYMVARNKKYEEDDIVTFYRRLKNLIKELDDDWKNKLKEIMQNVVKLYYVKLDTATRDLLEEGVICMKE